MSTLKRISLLWRRFTPLEHFLLGVLQELPGEIRQMNQRRIDLTNRVIDPSTGAKSCFISCGTANPLSTKSRCSLAARRLYSQRYGFLWRAGRTYGRDADGGDREDIGRTSDCRCRAFQDPWFDTTLHFSVSSVFSVVVLHFTTEYPARRNRQPNDAASYCWNRRISNKECRKKKGTS
jgi:hypothetical protein